MRSAASFAASWWADDIARPAQRDRLGTVLGVSAALVDHQRHERRGIAEHDLAHQLVAAFAHAEDVEQAARLQCGDGLGADHAAVGDNADTANGEALAQPIDHRHQGGHIGGVAWPHLRAHRASIAVDQHGEDHLTQIGPVVLAVTMLSDRLAAQALEVQAGGVHEHQVEPAEQIAPMREQLLLDQVLRAAR